jgi:purine-nucleoside phosphorylase
MVATIHMNADPGEFAETVLMPGDPLRAKYIAETFLEDSRQVSDVRNMLGFTGGFQGYPVSVMAHGMGIPSASIYCTELIRDYGVKRVLRVGSCGTVHPDVELRDIVIAATILPLLPASISCDGRCEWPKRGDSAFTLAMCSRRICSIQRIPPSSS